MGHHTITIGCEESNSKMCCTIKLPSIESGGFKLMPGDTLDFVLMDTYPGAKVTITIKPRPETGAQMSCIALLPIVTGPTPIGPFELDPEAVGAIRWWPGWNPPAGHAFHFDKPVAPSGLVNINKLPFYGVFDLVAPAPLKRTIRLCSNADSEWRYRFTISCHHCCNDCDPGDPPDMVVGP